MKKKTFCEEKNCKSMRNALKVHIDYPMVHIFENFISQSSIVTINTIIKKSKGAMQFQLLCFRFYVNITKSQF